MIRVLANHHHPNFLQGGEIERCEYFRAFGIDGLALTTLADEELTQLAHVWLVELGQQHALPGIVKNDPIGRARVVRAQGRQSRGRMCGNSNTSRMLAESVNSITRRSTPMPSPAVGGRPCSSAVT